MRHGARIQSVDTMSRFAFLILPSSNRVYAAATVALAGAELEVFNQAAMGGRICDVEPSDIGGVRYITFACDNLPERDAAMLANLSSLYALYRIEGDMLRPLALHRLDRLDDDLITIQKYPCKTNEQFTKLLLNVTLLSSSFATDMLERKFSVLDPLCGRGTTLNQALMYGFDAYGIEMDKQDVEAYSVFIQRWLKDKRLKHQASFGPVRRERQIVARRLQVSFAAAKEDYKAGIVQHIDVVSAETTRVLEFFRPESVDLVVADAPYGIQHGSRAQGKGLKRSPLHLIAEAAPVWARVLRPGGAIGISWNTFVARREDATTPLAAAGLQVMDSGPYLGFRHRVDQAILRDVLVARKPSKTRGG
jgi:SAM-dependent methyltransferase